MTDEIPDLGAQIDQMLRASVDIAHVLRGYHVALVGEGFTEDQALQLTLAFYHELMEASK